MHHVLPIRHVGRDAVGRQRGRGAGRQAEGLRDNTLILFHSDNGGTTDKKFAGQMADMSKVTLPCDNGPYRSGKGALFEGGCRVAAFANWPGHIKAQTVDGMIHAVDIYPTLAALAGVLNTLVDLHLSVVSVERLSAG